METRQSIRRVRAVRRFADRPLPGDVVEQILDGARHAGSAKNLQRWDFIVVTDRETLARLGAVGPWAGHLAGAAVAIALVTPEPRGPGAPLSVAFDLGRAAQNMVLSAWELGVGTCPVTVYHQAMCRRILGYPLDRHCGYMLSIGYPADPADLDRPSRPAGRRRLEDIVHAERW